MTSLKVAVRVRPLSERESILDSKVVVDVQGKDILVTDVKVPEKHGCDHRVRVHQFTFDYGFWSVEPSSKKCASQRTVYEEFGRIVLNTLLEGYNCCVIAYGPSGSGKTYTVMGTKEESGLTPRICEGLFTKLADQTDHHLPFHIDISFMELYNEQVFDLLQKKEVQNIRKPKLRIREHPVQGPFVEGLSTHAVRNIDEVCDLLARGNAERTNAANHVHERSSRSHAIFTIRCSQACLDQTKPKEVVSKLHLVDLAGSEKAAPEFCNLRVKEGGNINKSLVTLGNVIAVLVEMSLRSRTGGITRRQTYVPYRDSHLTWLLKDSLGGNSHTFMLAAISPSKECYIDTVSTLRYAQRAKLVMNRPIVNEDPSTEMIRNLRTEVARLRNLLSTAEKLSRAYIMKPLPEITQLKSIMKESARKVDVLTKHWFEKWLQTYDVVINQVGSSETNDYVTDTCISALQKNDEVSVISCLDVEIDNSLQDSTECVIMNNEVVGFYRNKGFNENNDFQPQTKVHNSRTNVENKQLDSRINENIQLLRKDFADQTKCAFRKNFESVSENTLQISRPTDSKAVRSLSLSLSQMKKPFGMYTWLVRKTIDSDIETESSLPYQISLHEEEKSYTRNEDNLTTVWDTYHQKKDRIDILVDNSLKNKVDECGTVPTPENVEDYEATFCPEKEEVSAVTESTDREKNPDETICESAHELKIGPDLKLQRDELKMKSDNSATTNKEMNDTIHNDALPNDSCCEIPSLVLDLTRNEKTENFKSDSKTPTRETFKCKEFDCQKGCEVTFSEQVREESNNLVELLKSIEPDSTESGSGYCSPKRKDSEIMSLLSFSSLDGQYFRSLDDFTSTEENSASTYTNELHRSSVNGESMSSCNSDVNAVKPFRLRILEGADSINETQPFIRGLSGKELNIDTDNKPGSGLNNSRTNVLYTGPETDYRKKYSFVINKKSTQPEESHLPDNCELKPRSEYQIMNGSTFGRLIERKHSPPNEETIFEPSYTSEIENMLKQKSEINESITTEMSNSPQTVPESNKSITSEASEVVYATSFELTKANLDILAEKLRDVPESTQNYAVSRKSSHSEAFRSQISSWVPQQKTSFGFALTNESNNGQESVETSNIPGKWIVPVKNNVQNRMERAERVIGSEFQFNVEKSFDQMSVSHQKHGKPLNNSDINHDHFGEEINLFPMTSVLASKIVEDSLKRNELPWEYGDKSTAQMISGRPVEDAIVVESPSKVLNFPNSVRTLMPTCINSFNLMRTKDCDESSDVRSNSNLLNRTHLLSKEDENKHKESEKDTESDFDTFTLDSLDNFDHEMKAWAQKYLTKCDSQPNSFLGSDKILKPEIISSGTEFSELREFELTANPGKFGDSGAEMPFRSYQSQKDLSSCSSSSSSSDSITYVFVGKGEEDRQDTNMNNINSTSQYSSLQSSVSLDSLEKTGLQHKFFACPSPRTLSIDSLVAEELFRQLKNSEFGPVSKSDPVEQVNSTEISRVKQKTIISPNLQMKPMKILSPASKVTAFEANITKTDSSESNHELKELNSYKNENNICDMNHPVSVQKESTSQTKCKSQNVADKSNSEYIIDVNDFTAVNCDKQTEATTIINSMKHDNVDNASTIGNITEDLNLVIPPPSSFKTHFVNADNTMETTRAIEMVSKDTQTQEFSFPVSDVQKPCDTSANTDVLQLAFRMMELMTEIFKCLKELKTNNSTCCGARNYVCEHCHMRKKRFSSDSSDTWTCSSNASLEVDQYFPQGNTTKVNRSKKETLEKDNQYKFKSSSTTSCSGETSDYKCPKETKRRRRHAKRETRSDFQPIDEYVRNQLLQLPSFARELVSLQEKEQCSRETTAGSNRLNQETSYPHIIAMNSDNQVSVPYKASYSPPPSTEETIIRDTTVENHLKHLTEIRRRISEETNHLQNIQRTSLGKDENGNHSVILLNKKKAQSNSSSEGYLSSISSHGESSHCSETRQENRCQKTFPCNAASANKPSKSPKTKPLLLDVGTGRNVTPPKTSWQNTSADSGAFFMDSPLIEKKDFVDMNVNPYICKESVSHCQTFPKSSVGGDLAECKHNISKIPEKLSLSHEWANDARTASPSSLASTLKMRNSRDGEVDLTEMDEDSKMPSSIIINKITPKCCILNRDSSPYDNNSTSARTEFVKKLSDDNYKLTREDIERILMSIEADKKFLRRKRNPILDRCYSPEITLCSPSQSDESLFSCDSFKKIPHPVLYVRAEASGLPA